MEIKQQKSDVSPSVGNVMPVLSEAAMLSESALVGIMYLTDGQSVDGYYTSDDISTYWD